MKWLLWPLRDCWKYFLKFSALLVAECLRTNQSPTSSCVHGRRSSSPPHAQSASSNNFPEGVHCDAPGVLASNLSLTRYVTLIFMCLESGPGALDALTLVPKTERSLGSYAPPRPSSPTGRRRQPVWADPPPLLDLSSFPYPLPSNW